MSEAIPRPLVGQPVVFIDEHRQERAALVKHVWPGMSGVADGVNVVVVCADADRQDSCGRQDENKTSVPHISQQPAGGYAWKHVGE